MAESLEKVDQARTSSTSGEVSVELEKEAEGGSIRNGYGGEVHTVDCSSSDAPVSNGGGDSSGLLIELVASFFFFAVPIRSGRA
mgnify:CR=1 FL=1